MNSAAYAAMLFHKPTQPIVAAPTPLLLSSLLEPTGVNSDIVYEMVNRNKRKLKRANHGARPNNSRGRKARRLRRH